MYINGGPIITDVILEVGDTIGNTLKVIHTPGHIPLYDKEHRTLRGRDILFNSILNIDALFVPPSTVTQDWKTSIVSARRLLSLKIEKLLLPHRANPILEKASRMIENAVSVAIRHKNTTAK